MPSHTNRWIIERYGKDNYSVFNKDMNRDICGITRKEAIFTIINEIELSLITSVTKSQKNLKQKN